MSAADFSREGYRAILERAKKLGYVISGFRGFSEPTSSPRLLLRHDLDHSLRSALVIARLEADLGLRATYFVQTTCDFYNLLGTEGRAVVAELVSLGHEIGLHYDARRYKGEGSARHLACDLALLADMSGQPVISASQHIPVDGERVDLGAAILNEAYAPRFTQAPMSYISDSLVRWRHQTPHDLLDRRESFQFLTHPMKWAGAPLASMSEALDRALDEDRAELERLRAEVGAYYDALLRDRARLDAEFKAQRAEDGWR